MVYPIEVKRVMDILRQEGREAYLVGGCLRNILMGKDPHDWDMTTSALPHECAEIFSKEGFHVIETGIKHGTVTVIVDGTPLEITTYRIETGYSDNRHPDKVDFTDKVEDDLSRRDFTVNAIAYSPEKGFADPFDGMADIKSKTIKCVGNPDKRFGEDALRILRALRFSAVLGFEIDKETAESIRRNYKLLRNISVERIFVEISKLLCGNDASRILREYEDVFFFILPEISPMKNCSQNHDRHIYDVWGHTVKAVENIDAIPEMRFAMLFQMLPHRFDILQIAYLKFLLNPLQFLN